MAPQTFSLVNIILLESNFVRDWILNLDNPKFKNNVDIKVNSQRNEEHLSVIIDLSYSAGLEGGKTEMKADIKMVGVFTVPEQSELPVETFTNVNAPAIIFPFLREHLASLSMKAAINPIMLQPVNFVKGSEPNKGTSNTVSE
ncbi:protein-export chaperone SecB [Mucilaginibacter sp. UR6-11]|uniref:protein-export chaperone SecB n=1 Tax=Mucilaginibacter sp. UR6-11 TaxID=1435644 RepID=UPI001E35D472|nr:protein-export chaperone SecB [Mucilaginibacter sp. UR6-11]MCC8426952.1 protein-export chaperone SecB [Mucilaginibacter sp. UR6-11]